MTQPIYKQRKGKYSIAIFQDNDKKSIALQKSFKKNDEWKNQKMTVFPNELSGLIGVLIQAQKVLKSG